MTEPMSPPRRLFETTLDRLISELGLNEVNGEGGGPYLPLTSHAPFHEGRCGQVRLFESDQIFRVVSCTLVAPAIFLDSHMVFAFTESGSAVPHFTLDSVKAAENFAFHLDLIPKVDLGVNLPYMNWAFAPLNEAYDSSREIEGLTRAHITPLQHAIMSPWMLVHRASEDAFERIGPLVESYISHWLSLVKEGAPDGITGGLSKQDLINRDLANKSLIFDPDVDKVWNQIRGLIGDEAVEQTRGLLKATSS